MMDWSVAAASTTSVTSAISVKWGLGVCNVDNNC